jgi:hypothetical protein
MGLSHQLPSDMAHSTPPPASAPPTRTRLRRSPSSSPSTHLLKRPTSPAVILHEALLTTIAAASIDGGPRRLSDPTDLNSPNHISFDASSSSDPSSSPYPSTETGPSLHNQERRPSLQFRRSPSSILHELSFGDLPSGLDRLVPSQDGSRKATSVPATACFNHAGRSSAVSPSDGEPDTPLASRAAFVSRSQSMSSTHGSPTPSRRTSEDVSVSEPPSSITFQPPTDPPNPSSSSTSQRLRTGSQHSSEPLEPPLIGSNRSSIDHGSFVWSKVHYNPRLQTSSNISAVSATGGSISYATTPETESDDSHNPSSRSRSHSHFSSYPRHESQLSSRSSFDLSASKSHRVPSHAHSQSIDISDDLALSSSSPPLHMSFASRASFSSSPNPNASSAALIPNNVSSRRPEAAPRLDSFDQQSLRDHYRHVFLNHTRPIGRDDGIVVSTQTAERGLLSGMRKERRASNNNMGKGTGELTLGLGSFGTALRHEVSGVIKRGLPGVALSGDESEVVGIGKPSSVHIYALARDGVLILQGPSSFLVEYGSLHGQSFSLVPDIITTILRSNPSSQPCFTVLHQDHRLAFSTYQSSINSSDLSYLYPTFLDNTNALPNGRERVFSSISTRPFGSLVVPTGTVSVGFSLLDLHWLHALPREGISASMMAEEELHGFLSARATEFKPTGLLVVAFLLGSGRSSTASGSNVSLLSSPQSEFSSEEDEVADTVLSPIAVTHSHQASLASSNHATDRSRHRSSMTEADVWRQLSSALSTCITRLVGFQKIKASVAPRLLALNLWTRSGAELRKSLSAESVREKWEVVESRGLGKAGEGDGVDGLLEDKGPVNVCSSSFCYHCFRS